jgi:hypothetical protein
MLKRLQTRHVDMITITIAGTFDALVTVQDVMRDAEWRADVD